MHSYTDKSKKNNATAAHPTGRQMHKNSGMNSCVTHEFCTSPVEYQLYLVKKIMLDKRENK